MLREAANSSIRTDSGYNAAMRRHQPTLDEAMRKILREQPERAATLQTLCDENKRLDLYRQDGGDGSHPEPFQFKLRTFKHRDLEFREPDLVVLDEGK
jgi:hypothetical protein